MEDFGVRWAWEDDALEPGFTGVLRVRDEARTLPFALPPLLRAVSRVVLVDNGSTDGTPDLARAIAAEHGAADRLDVHHYPFAIARCGDEHLATPADSVHSLVHFYNWSFAHVRTSYALKWDGDMVLSDAAVAALRDLAWQLEAAEVVVKVPRNPLYVADERRAFVDLDLRNVEPWGWPNRAGFVFAKALEWELPLWRADIATVTLPDWSCVEVKHLDADEFAHWSHTDFGASARTRRKQREWEVFGALARGDEPPAGVVAVEAPDARHVIDYVRSEWLPAREPIAAGAPG
jgi:glycosyltransferase involved in cell wall biosynthesis